SWVEEKTRERIKELIPKKAVDRNTCLVVTNAIYFKGDWAKPFEKKQTKEEPFTLADGKKVQAPLMHAYLNVARYAAFEKDGTFFPTPQTISGEEKQEQLYPGEGGFELLELPYKGGDLSMVVILPRSSGGLGALEKRLTGGRLRAWI